MIYDPGVVDRSLQQRCVEKLLALVRQSLRDLLAHTRTVQRQVLRREPLLSELEDVPLAAAAKSHGLRVITYLHRPQELGNQVRWEVVVPQILFRRKTDVTAHAQAVDFFALGASNGREISFPLKLLVNVVDGEVA